MADYRIVVVVDVSQARANLGKVRGDLRGTKTDADNAARSLAYMAKAFVGSAIVREVAQVADSYQNLRNRIRNTGSDVDVTYKRLLDIAQKTRQPLEAVGQVYQRTALSIRELGYSTNVAANFTEQLTKIVAYSGATSTEASQAMIQLSQALGAGALRGDELRAVFEEMPELLRIVAQHMGITTGQIRAMAKDGKITSSVIIESLAASADVIDKKFGDVLPTIGGRVQQVKNAFIDWAGRMSQDSGIYSAITDILGGMAAHIDTVGKALVAMAEILAGLALYKGLMLVVDAVKALNAAAAANPFGVMVKALIVLIPLLIEFQDKINGILDSLPFVGHGGDASGNSPASAMDDEQLAMQAKGYREISSVGGFNYPDYLRTKQMEAAGLASPDNTFTQFKKEHDYSDVVVGRNNGGTNRTYVLQIKHDWNAFTANVQKSIDDISMIQGRDVGAHIKQQAESEKAAKAAAKEWEKFLHALDAVLKKLDPIGEILANEAEDMAVLDQAKRAGLTTGGPHGILPGAGSQGQVGSYDEELRLARIAQSGLALGKSADERGLFDVQSGSLADEQDFTEQIIEGTKEMTATLYQFKKELAEIPALYEAWLSKQHDLNSGVVSALHAMGEIANDAASDIRDAMLNAFSNINEALVTLVVKGKLSFKDLIDTLLGDLTRLLLHKAEAGLGSYLNIPGFAGGVSDFRVGGSGGQDSQLVMMRLSPSEHVSVTQQPTPVPVPYPNSAASGGGVRRGDSVDMQVVFPFQPGAMLGVSSSRAGRRSTQEGIELDANAVAAMLRTRR